VRSASSVCISSFGPDHTDLLRNLVHDVRQSKQVTLPSTVVIYAADMLERLAPKLLDGTSTFFTEEQMGKLGDSAADCGIDFGHFVLVGDIVQHAFTMPTRALGDAAAFKKDGERSVEPKTRQLSQTIDKLLGDASDPAHPLGGRPHQIVPMIVEGPSSRGRRHPHLRPGAVARPPFIQKARDDAIANIVARLKVTPDPTP
jgi:hypothetical protein